VSNPVPRRAADRRCRRRGGWRGRHAVVVVVTGAVAADEQLGLALEVDPRKTGEGAAQTEGIV